MPPRKDDENDHRGHGGYGGTEEEEKGCDSISVWRRLARRSAHEYNITGIFAIFIWLGSSRIRALHNCYALFRRTFMDTQTMLILLIIATVLALPGGLFVAGMLARARTRWAALLGGLIGAVVVAAAVFAYVSSAPNLSLDGLTYFLGAFFAVSVGAFSGALLINFLFGLGGRTPDISSEF
jgi:hypothetical protein